MSLSDLASLGSFVSGFAVLVSLIYLALHVRQTQKNQRALMMQGQTNETVTRHATALLQVPAIRAMWKLVRSSYESSFRVTLDELSESARRLEGRRSPGGRGYLPAFLSALKDEASGPA